MQVLSEYEIDYVNGGSRIVTALDWIGRALTAVEAGKIAAGVGDALLGAEGTHDSTNPLEGNRNAK